MQTSQPRTNDEWLAALREPSTQGLSDLRTLIVRGLTRSLGSRTDARGSIEDFAQESVVRILGHLDDFRGESRFTSWALAIAMRVAFSELRRRRWRDVSLEDAPPPQLSAAAEAAHPEQALAREEITAIVMRTVSEALTEKQRLVIFAELRELPQAEISARYGLSRNALYKLGHDARRALKRALADAGFDRDSLSAVFEEP